MPLHVTPKAERIGPQCARLTLEDGTVVEVSRFAERVTFEAARGPTVLSMSIDEAGFAFALGVMFPEFPAPAAEGDRIAALAGALRALSRGDDEDGEPCFCVGEYVGQRPVPGRSHDAECVAARLALADSKRSR